MTEERIENTFTYHAPTGDQPERYEKIRAAAKALAYVIQDACLESPEKTRALADLQGAVMWANASVALTKPEWHPV